MSFAAEIGPDRGDVIISALFLPRAEKLRVSRVGLPEVRQLELLQYGGAARVNLPGKVGGAVLQVRDQFHQDQDSYAESEQEEGHLKVEYPPAPQGETPENPMYHSQKLSPQKIDTKDAIPRKVPNGS